MQLFVLAALVIGDGVLSHQGGGVCVFTGLSSRLEDVFRRLRSRGKLTEANIRDALREVRLALLEADVNYGVVKDFIERVREKAVGTAVLQSLTPGQQS